MDYGSDIINKVEQSGLVTIDPETLKPTGERIVFDLKDFLYEELLLKEKDFREKLKSHSWEMYQDKYVALTCTADAIIPLWAYMLAASWLEPRAKKVFSGNLEQLEESLFLSAINAMDTAIYSGQRVVIKGCSKGVVPVSAYVQLTAKLKPVAKSILFGEPCSTVPIYKSGKQV